LCAVQTRLNGSVTGQYQYLYNAEGTRVGKASFTGTFPWKTTCAAPGAASGFNLTNQYLLDQGGNQVTELNGTGGWVHSNVWAGAHLDATYDTSGLHFHLADPLGTRRVQANVYGVIEESFQSLPFGDGLAAVANPNCLPANHCYSEDATEHHFTGKERDTESGNDYFGARYYSSAMGRFMSPDKPFADQHPANPQSWNLYSYTRNNPLRFIDNDGHLVKDANGNVVFTPLYTETEGVAGGRPFPTTFADGSSGYARVTWQAEVGNVYTDSADGPFLPVEASRAITSMQVTQYDASGNLVSQGGSELLGAGFSATADCHGTTFADGQLWINNDQVPAILYGDNYSPTSSPGVGDVGIYSTNGSPFTAQHSVTVDGTDASGAVTSVTSKGGITPKTEATPATGWPDPNASLDYYHKPPPQTPPNQ